jgi:hypothetical protein
MSMCFKEANQDVTPLVYKASDDSRHVVMIYDRTSADRLATKLAQMLLLLQHLLVFG